MQEKVITIASLFFFIMIAGEYLLARRWQVHTYRLNDSINSLSLGIISQIVGVFQKLLSIGIYAWVVEHIALFHLASDAIWVWLSGLLLYDFFYYWLHRMGHETSLLWAAHVVHHQSECYNLTTALRQTSSGAVFGWVFYLPLAILGYPVEVFAAIALIDLLYQFWVHTELVGKLGWFDRIFVSPSNHRVHHAVNDCYIDKNYGGILIVWDRLFGTFIEEKDSETIVYGTRSPLHSWNPLYANIEVYWAVAQDAWHTRHWLDKLRIWFKPPGWLPADLAQAKPQKTFNLHRAIYNPPLPRTRLIYCLVHFVIILEVTTHFLNAYGQTDWTNALVYGAWLVSGLWIVGGLLQNQSRYVWLESLRLLVTLMLVASDTSWFQITILPGWIRLFIGALCLLSFGLLHVSHRPILKLR